MILYFDTSVLVAASVQGHPHYTSAFYALETMVQQNHRGFVSLHGLAEVYSVLTRAPFTPPVFPSEAWKIINESILASLEVVTLTAEEYRTVLRECAESGILGGRVHDAIHLQSARKVKADRVYTFNVKDFRLLAGDSVIDKICSP